MAMGRDTDNWVEQIAISSKRFFDDLGKWITDFFNFFGSKKSSQSSTQISPVEDELSIDLRKFVQRRMMRIITGLILFGLIFSSYVNDGFKALELLAIVGASIPLAYIFIVLDKKDVEKTTKHVHVLGEKHKVIQSQNAVKKQEQLSTLHNVYSTVSRYVISVPQTVEWSAESATNLITQLLTAFPSLILRISADSTGQKWEVVEPENIAQPGVIQRIIQAQYPRSTVVTQASTSPFVGSPLYRAVDAYKQVADFVAPLLYAEDIIKFDPLTAFAQTMGDLQPGDSIQYTFVTSGISDEAYKEGERMITQSTIHPLQLLTAEGRGNALGKILFGADRTQKFIPQDQRIFEEKLRQLLWRSCLIIQIDAPSEFRLRELAAQLDNHVRHFMKMPYNGLFPQIEELRVQLVQSAEQDSQTSALCLALGWMKRDNLLPLPPDLILEPREIAALWHLPHRGFSAPRMNWSKDAVDMSDAIARITEGISLGKGRYAGREAPVKLLPEDRVTHINIVGKTGTGKSTFMHNLIHADIARGEGVAVIDPHGSLVNDLLRSSIPPEREKDVVWLDLANTENPPPFNPLSNLNSYTGVMRVINIIDRLYPDTRAAAQTSTFLRASLALLEKQPFPTMRDVGRIFYDDVYRERLLNETDDPETRDLWDFQYTPATEGKRRQIADPVLNRIRVFYGNRYLYPVMCHPDNLDFRSLMRQNKIVLISLKVNGSIVPDQEQRLVGALLVSAMQIAGMEEQLKRPFYVYIDEVQDFVTTSLDEMLSEARKYGLSLTTAHQFLGQLEGKTLDAVMGNVGTSVMFACSPEDKNKLATYTKPYFTADQLTDLDRFQAVVKMQTQGQTQPAFSLSTLPPLPIPPDSEERAERIRQLSIKTYTPKTRQQVIDELSSRYPRKAPSNGVEQEKNQPKKDDDSEFYE